MTFSPIIFSNSYYLKHIKEIIDTKKENNDGKDSLQLLDYPPSYDNDKSVIKIKDFQKQQLRCFNQVVENLYENNNTNLLTTLPRKANFITHYKFHDKIVGFNFRSVEVSCRILSHFDASQIINTNTQSNSSGNNNTSNTNLFRIGNIKFKGNFQKVIDKLLDECLKSINKETSKKNDAACYVNFRCNHPPHISTWPCKKIQQVTIDNSSTIKNYFDSHKRNKENDQDYLNICFYQRQVIGHAFFPFVDLSDWKKKDYDANDENDNDHQTNCDINKDYFYQPIEEDNNILFDNLFISFTNDRAKDLKKSILGVYKKDISYKEKNFLSLGNEVISALMDFHIDRLGITSQGVNLYIKLKSNVPVYCTSAKSEIHIPNACEYLTNLCFDRTDYQKYLIKDKLATEASFNNEKIICVNKRERNEDVVLDNNPKKLKVERKKSKKEKIKIEDKPILKRDVAILNVYNNKKLQAKKKNIKIDDSEEDKHLKVKSKKKIEKSPIFLEKEESDKDDKSSFSSDEEKGGDKENKWILDDHDDEDDDDDDNENVSVSSSGKENEGEWLEED